MILVQKVGISKWVAVLVLGLGLGCGRPETEDESAESLDSALAPVVVTQYADVTGDNILDRIQRTSLNEFVVSIASSANVYGTPKLWTTIALGGAYKDAQQSQYVDLNNDGKKDLAFRGPDNKFWFATSTGAAFNTPGNWVTHGGGYNVDLFDAQSRL